VPPARALCQVAREDLTRCVRLLYRARMVAGKNARALKLSVPSEIVIEHAGDVLNFTLNNPGQGNQIAGAMFEAMLAELRSQASRPTARVLRIRARGKVFCTGRERAARDAKSMRRESQRVFDFKRALRNSSLISVAEVQGDATGFGFGMAILCDFSLVAEGAKLAFPEMRAGLAPAAIMAYLGEYTLPRFAFPLVLFGDPIEPRWAAEIGLISQVCAQDRLAPDADALVARILALDSSAARRCKQFFRTAQRNSFDRNCRLAVDALTSGGLALLARGK
jgi:methylglutaconyl-CoA hydratase